MKKHVGYYVPNFKKNRKSIRRKVITVHYMDVYTTVGINTIITWVLPCFIKTGEGEVNVHLFDQRRTDVGNLNPHLP